MNALSQFGTASLLVLHLTAPVLAHGPSAGKANHNWDFGVWVAGATGEENRNSYSEAQIFAAGVSVGRVVTDEIGDGWRRGHLEYIFN